MNRVDFMKQLESLLQSIPQAEREEALQYYRDYFDDAGEENEQSVIEALGNPAKVAENIKKDLNLNGYGYGYGDNGYQYSSEPDRAMTEYQQGASQNTTKENKLSGGMIALIVILCIFASPLLLGIGGALVGVLIGIMGAAIGLIAAWFSLILAFGAVTFALFVVLMVLFIVGIMCLFHVPLVGVVILGIGLVCGGIGILFMMLTVAMAGIATPAIIRGIVNLFHRIFDKKKLS